GHMLIRVSRLRMLCNGISTALVTCLPGSWHQQGFRDSKGPAVPSTCRSSQQRSVPPVQVARSRPCLEGRFRMTGQSQEKLVHAHRPLETPGSTWASYVRHLPSQATSGSGDAESVPRDLPSPQALRTPGEDSANAKV